MVICSKLDQVPATSTISYNPNIMLKMCGNLTIAEFLRYAQNQKMISEINCRLKRSISRKYQELRYWVSVLNWLAGIILLNIPNLFGNCNIFKVQYFPNLILFQIL